MAMTLVSTVTVGSGGAASIEFTGIAGTGKDLLLLMSLASERAGVSFDTTEILLNGVTTNSYSYRYLEGNGSTVSSFSGTEPSIIPMNSPAAANTNVFSNYALYIANYTSNTNKSISIDGVNERNDPQAFQRISAYSFSTSSAITSIKIQQYQAAYDLAQHSTASLYIIS
jgi:hypothetical protein